MKMTIACIACACATLLTACGGNTDNAAPTGPTGSADMGPAWLLTEQPADEQGVNIAKAFAQEGDSVVIRARIGGRVEPMAPGSPAFTVVDLSLPYCGQLTDENCPTPWDYCCETPETITANAATVQLVDDDGQPVSDDPTKSLSPLDELIIVGTVGPRPNPDVFLIRATGVYRVEG
ncbi:MAG: hypothetical protein Tsb0013_05070 [Phycisphaerales bacterium]